MTTALEEGEGSASRPGRSFPPGKTRYPLYRRLGGPLGRSGQVRKISPPMGFDPRTVQPVASRYTDWATGPTTAKCEHSLYGANLCHNYGNHLWTPCSQNHYCELRSKLIFPKNSKFRILIAAIIRQKVRKNRHKTLHNIVSIWGRHCTWHSEKRCRVQIDTGR